MKCTNEKIDKITQSCYTFGELELGGECMTPVEICKRLISKSQKMQKDVADKMGWTEQCISNKFRRNSLSATEFMKIVEYLGYEIKVVEKKTQVEVSARVKGVGERLRMMVNGEIYDTYKADAICHTDENNDTFDELYKDDEGRYFVAHYVKWEGGISSISPISENDAIRMSKKFKI